MRGLPNGRAVVYCQGAFNTPNGKTAHGLVRYTRRYKLNAVIDSRYAGQDAGMVLDGKHKDIPIVDSLEAALAVMPGKPATHFVVGLAPDGGRLSPEAFGDVKAALTAGLNVDCGLHDFLSENTELAALAAAGNCVIRDVRKPPHRNDLHFFSGKIEKVEALKIAVLGTDSAVGKRTTAWILVDAMNRAGYMTEFVGTGQTAWMQGAEYSIVLDSLVNDFVAGEIEHAVWRAWDHAYPDAIVVEGQGSLMNPAYPGGFEILAAARPDIVILQHAPARAEYDGFPGYPLHPLPKQIQAVEMLSGKPVVAVTLNHENMTPEEIPGMCSAIHRITGIPAFDVLSSGGTALARLVADWIPGDDRRKR